MEASHPNTAEASEMTGLCPACVTKTPVLPEILKKWTLECLHLEGKSQEMEKICCIGP